MWCNSRSGYFFSKHIWILLILGFWVFKGNWPLVIFLVFVAPWLIKTVMSNDWEHNNHRKPKNDDYDDYWYEDDGEKPKRRPVYVRTADGEFVELGAEDYEYI